MLHFQLKDLTKVVFFSSSCVEVKTHKPINNIFSHKVVNRNGIKIVNVKIWLNC